MAPPEEAPFYNALHDEIDVKIAEWNARPENREYTDRPYKHPLRISVNYDLPGIYERVNGLKAQKREMGPSSAGLTVDYAVSLENLKRLGLLPKTEDEPLSS